MKNCLIVVLLLIVFVSCNDQDIKVNIQTNGKIVLIDSTLLTNNFENYNPNDVENGYYPIYYIGNKKDTISLRKVRFEDDDFTRSDTIKNIFTANSENISINVDTNFKTSIDLKFKYYFQQDELMPIDSMYCYASFPFFINNLSDSSIFLGIGWVSLINIYLQATNKQGKWIDLKKPHKIECLTGFKNIVLLPKNLMIGKLIRKRGNYKTNCRLKFKIGDNIIYSNIFEDWIDKRQLEIDFSDGYEK